MMFLSHEKNSSPPTFPFNWVDQRNSFIWQLYFLADGEDGYKTDGLQNVADLDHLTDKVSLFTTFWGNNSYYLQ